MKKVLFVQLPLNDHGNNYVAGNIPYAASILTAYINKNFREIAKAEYIPVEFANYASNEAISKYIYEEKADLVGFACYLWNIERNLEIAKILKEKNGFNSIIVFGGSEITEDSVFLKENYVDYFFCGEGEWFFNKYFGEELYEKEKFIKQPLTEQIEVKQIIEPFINNYLNKTHDNSMFIEMTRGCPYKCIYCSYSKNSKKVRELSNEVLIKAANIAKNREIHEIYILAPTFDKSPEFYDTLMKLSEIENIQFHTEMRTDSIDEKTAKMIRKAGFHSLEVGIQTLTKEALKECGRQDKTEKELLGIYNLKKENISLKIGLIPGLPGDSPELFENTVESLCNNGLEKEIELYPLMILPGTTIRDTAKKYKSNYMKKPPYYQISNYSFSEDDLLRAKDRFERRTGLFNISDLKPDFFHNGEAKLNKGIFVTTKERDWKKSILSISQDSYVFTFFIETDSIEELIPIIYELSKNDMLYNVVLLSDNYFDDDSLIQLLTNIDQDCFYRRLHYFDEWLRGTKIKFYQLVKQKKTYISILEKNSVIEPIMILGDDYEEIDNEYPLTYLLEPRISKDVFEKIKNEYSDYPELLRFTDYAMYVEYIDVSVSGNIKPNPRFKIESYDKLISYIDNE